MLENVLKEKLRKLIKVNGRQFGFCPGRSTTDAIFIMRQLQMFSEKKRRNCVIHAFVDLEKARKAIEWALRRQKVPERLMTVCRIKIKSENSSRNIRGF